MCENTSSGYNGKVEYFHNGILKALNNPTASSTAKLKKHLLQITFSS